MVRNQFLFQAKTLLIDSYGTEKGELIAKCSLTSFLELCKENELESKKMYPYTRGKIYPCIAILDAQVQNGVSREEAIAFNFKFIEWRSYEGAKIVSKIMKIPGVYKKMPVFFGNMTKKKFGVKQNFEATFYEVSSKKMRFDMTKCPYADLLKRYGYPEITKAFCRGDDIVYGNMHEKLVWERTKTIGDGNECCDFKLTLKE